MLYTCTQLNSTPISNQKSQKSKILTHWDQFGAYHADREDEELQNRDLGLGDASIVDMDGLPTNGQVGVHAAQTGVKIFIRDGRDE